MHYIIYNLQDNYPMLLKQLAILISSHEDRHYHVVIFYSYPTHLRGYYQYKISESNETLLLFHEQLLEYQDVNLLCQPYSLLYIIIMYVKTSSLHFLFTRYTSVMTLEKPKIALVADWITHWGGAERLFVKLMEMYPEADIYTSVFFPDRPELFAERKVFTSFIQHIPFLNRKHKLCMLLRPLAFSRFDFSDYDLVISSSSAEAKGIHTSGKTKHICYCHTPTRYLWSHSEAYKNFLEF